MPERPRPTGGSPRPRSRRRPRGRPTRGTPVSEPGRRALTRALSRLPAEQRLVLALFAVEGLPHAEIAAILGVPVGTIWSRLHLARKRLAAALEANAGE